MDGSRKLRKLKLRRHKIPSKRKHKVRAVSPAAVYYHQIEEEDEEDWDDKEYGCEDGICSMEVTLKTTLREGMTKATLMATKLEGEKYKK